MATAANITFANLDTGFEVSIDHDGYPTFTLKVIREFLQGNYHDIGAFGLQYRSQYGEGCSADWSDVPFSNPHWEYVIDANGELKVYCHEMGTRGPGGSIPCDPYIMLAMLEDDYVEAERQVLDDEIAALADLGVEVHRPVPVKEQLRNMAATNANDFF